MKNKQKKTLVKLVLRIVHDYHAYRTRQSLYEQKQLEPLGQAIKQVTTEMEEQGLR